MAKLAIVAAALILPASFAGWDYASPSWALSGFKDAFQKRDASTAAGYIDFPALRDNLKSGLRARYTSNVLAAGAGGLAPLSDTKFAAIDRMVDSTVTPAGMDLLFAKAAETRDGGTPQNHATAEQQAATMAFVIHRTGWREFEVTPASGYPLGLVFTREGLSWKLTNVRLPADLVTAFAPPAN
jgi:hypothetical protein